MTDDSTVPDNPFEGFELPEFAQQAGLERTDDGDGLRFIRDYANDEVSIEVYWLPLKRQHYRAKLYDGVGADRDHLEEATSDSVEGLAMCVEYLLRSLPTHRNPDQPASETFDTSGEWTA